MPMEQINLKKDYENNDLWNELIFNNDQTAVETAINKFIASVTDGDSGADSLAMTPIGDVDATLNRLQPILEMLVTRLKRVTDGDSGADFVNATGIGGLTGSTVQALLESLKTYIDTINSTHKNNVILDHPDSSVTTTKIANDAVTTTKIANDAVTETKIINNAVTDAKLGNRTANQSIADVSADTGTITQLLSWIAKSIKELKATTNWYDSPADTVASINARVGTIEANKADTSNVYTQTQLQTSGQSQVHFNNITNVPNLADNSWKEAVATYNDLPTIDNNENDMRIVANDGDGKTAMYRCKATSGIISDQWEKIADLDWTNDHSALVGLGDDDHTQYHNDVRGDARYYKQSEVNTLLDGKSNIGHEHLDYVTKTGGNFTGNVDFEKNQAINLTIHNNSSAPATPAIGQLWYDTTNNQLKVYKASGWVDVSGKGAIKRRVEITATEAQTAFDVGQSSTFSYEVGTDIMNVYFKNGDRYELVDKDDYTETNNETITIPIGATSGDEYLFEWFENQPEVIEAGGSSGEVTIPVSSNSAGITAGDIVFMTSDGVAKENEIDLILKEDYIFSSNSTEYLSTCKLSENRYIVCYSDGGNNSYGSAYVLNITGDNYKIRRANSVPFVFCNERVTNIKTCELDENKILVLYHKYISNEQAIKVLEINDNTITSGAEVIISASMCTPIAKDFVLMSTGFATPSTIQTALVDGTSITLSSPVTVGFQAIVGVAKFDTNTCIAFHSDINGYLRGTIIYADANNSFSQTFTQDISSGMYSGNFVTACNIDEGKILVCSTSNIVVLTLNTSSTTGYSFTYGQPVQYSSYTSGFHNVSFLSKNNAIICYKDNGSGTDKVYCRKVSIYNDVITLGKALEISNGYMVSGCVNNEETLLTAYRDDGNGGKGTANCIKIPFTKPSGIATETKTTGDCKVVMAGECDKSSVSLGDTISSGDYHVADGIGTDKVFVNIYKES